MKVRFLHCADLHIDAPFTSLGSSGTAEIRRHEVRLAFRRIIALAGEEAVDFVLIAGDLFEHDYAGKPTAYFLRDEFESISQIPVVLIPGNHDPYVPGSLYSSLDWPSNVYILDGAPKKLELGTKAAVYCAIPDAAPDGDRINILLLHATAGMNPDGKAYNPYSFEELDGCGMDYVALGHFHNRIEAAGSRKIIYNPGSPEPLGFDEEGAHGVFIVSVEKTADESSINTAFIPIGLRCYKNLTVRLDQCPTDEKAAEQAAEAMRGMSSDDLYALTLTGTTMEGFRPDIKRIAGYLKDLAFYIKIKDETVPGYDLEKIAAEPGLKGLFTGKMLARAAAAAGDEERKLVMQALYYGLEAIERGEVSIDVY